MKRLEKDPNPLRIQINTEYSAARFLPTVNLDALPLVICLLSLCFQHRLIYVLNYIKLCFLYYMLLTIIQTEFCSPQYENQRSLLITPTEKKSLLSYKKKERRAYLYF